MNSLTGILVFLLFAFCFSATQIAAMAFKVDREVCVGAGAILAFAFDALARLVERGAK